MDIKESILSKFVPRMAVAQIKENYSQMGYLVEREFRVDNIRPDLVLRRDSEYVIFEIKTKKLTKKKKEKIRMISQYVNSRNNFTFKLVFANAPKEKSVEIVGIEEILTQYLMDHMPDEILELGTHSIIDEVSDVELDWVEINQDGTIDVQGNGILSIELQYGSSGDLRRGDAIITYHSFPFRFDAILNVNGAGRERHLTLAEMNNLDIDTESFEVL